MPLKRAHSDLYLTKKVSLADEIIYYYEDDLKRRRLTKTQCGYDPRDAIELFEMLERREGFTATHRPLGVPGHRTFPHRHRMFYRMVTVETQEYKSFETKEEAVREARRASRCFLLWIYYGRPLKNHHVIAAAAADAGNVRYLLYLTHSSVLISMFRLGEEMEGKLTEKYCSRSTLSFLGKDWALAEGPRISAVMITRGEFDSARPARM